MNERTISTVLLGSGFGLVIAGVAAYSMPIAAIVAGVFFWLVGATIHHELKQRTETDERVRRIAETTGAVPFRGNGG